MGRPADNTGVVAQDVRGAVVVEGALSQRLHGLLQRGVADHGEHVAAGLAQLRLDQAEADLVDVGQHDVHPFGDEALGQTFADATTGARHDGDFARQLFHHGPLGTGAFGTSSEHVTIGSDVLRFATWTQRPHARHGAAWKPCTG